jgi:hypothetical protein
LACVENGVYIAMQGLVLPYERVVKNRKLAKFEPIKESHA